MRGYALSSPNANLRLAPLTKVNSRYVRSLESQQTRLIRALEKVHRHSRQAVDQEAMKEIVAIVRSCDYDFTAEDPGPTLGKPEKAANLLESHVSGPNGITAREQVDLKAVLEDSDFSQTNVDTSAHSAPQKKRKLGFESSEYIASGLESTGSQDVFGPSSHEQDQPQTPSSANADTATCLAQYDERQGIQSIWAEVGKPNGQSVHIDPIPDADFGFPRDTTMFDTYNSSSYEPQISFLDTLDGCSPTLSYLDPDTQFTDLNGFNPSFADTSIMADTVNRQTMTDLDSQIWWDPSILFHTTIGDVGSQDSASELFPDSLNVPMS